MIETHSVSKQSFADDTQLLQSRSPDQIHATVLTTQTCISEVMAWMTQNKLKLNDDKTETFLRKSDRTNFPDAQPTSLRVSTADIPFMTCVRNLGFMISDKMTCDKRVSTVCRSAYVAIRCTSSIRQCLTVEATATLACAFEKQSTGLNFKLDYCNSPLSSPLYLLSRLQKGQNSAAKIVFKARKRGHVEPLLQTLYWLSVQTRIDNQLPIICHNFSCLFL